MLVLVLFHLSFDGPSRHLSPFRVLTGALKILAFETSRGRDGLIEEL
jgi:hypothetical protein